MMESRSTSISIVIKSAGDLASGVACRLYRARFRKLVLLDIEQPTAVRRRVSFSEAVYDGEAVVEGIRAERVRDRAGIEAAWSEGIIPVLVDPDGRYIQEDRPMVLVDAILAKRNLGTHITDAPLVLGLGPGFVAGKDVHAVIETRRGHYLGLVILSGSAEANTGIPGDIAGRSYERVFRSENAGLFETHRDIGEMVSAGDEIGRVNDQVVKAAIDGVIRGLIRPGIPVMIGTKLGDIDPRGQVAYCDTISDKARAIGGAVLEAILSCFGSDVLPAAR
jgi:xanthine dehydrogenase accessory factor